MTRRIGSLGRVVTGKTPPTADPSNFGGPYPFITIPDLDGRAVIRAAERTLSERGAGVVRTSMLPSGSVMMSCIATVGKCGITARPSFTNQQINSVVPDDGTDARFLYYVFMGLGGELDSAGGGGSVYANVSKARFSDIEVRVPGDIDEQRAIAHILGTLDDKIELNRRMNETLEAMARALFKSWFVDFDPVHAKAEGRDTGLPPCVAELFPDSFEDSELGEIPKGWEVQPLGGLGALAIGGDWGEDEAFASAVRATCLRGVDLEHLRRDGDALPPRRWFRPASLERRAMDERDVLIAGSGAGPTGRSLWMCRDLLLTLDPCVYSNFCKRIRCNSAAQAVYADAWLHGMRESGEVWEYVN
ncbi:MAG: restriction endonuclease subunit S, partial [Candidatus Bipolaricaulota bacterium]|nr:restriction endonuclease subunit S [Candidatus Bipolaricaulota bacterium]